MATSLQSKSGAGRRGTLAAGVIQVLAWTGCLVGPPVVEPPRETDTPPFYLPEDVTPDPSTLLVIQLGDPGPVAFELQNVFDWDPGDKLMWEWSVREPGNELPAVRDGEFLPREPNPYPEVGTFQGTEFELERCGGILNEGTARLTVTLRITDEIPEALRLDPRVPDYELAIVWQLVVEGQCTGEP